MWGDQSTGEAELTIGDELTGGDELTEGTSWLESDQTFEKADIGSYARMYEN